MAVDEGAHLNTASNLKTLLEHLAVDEGGCLNTVSNLKTLPEQVAVDEGAHLNTVSNLNILPEQVAVRGFLYHFLPFSALFLNHLGSVFEMSKFGVLTYPFCAICRHVEPLCAI